ncbi:uncharacterized protein LOC125317800 [Corvus hawaiiensis]|uniref:uncharacterized protein LOC125317800 n=1 Tax=Corvus hawaiiensis TaxID=134902 RepID=UPI002018E5B5|nr:uncharacterized protein LOC125317800 [Corvus hawaiiensis]
MDRGRKKEEPAMKMSSNNAAITNSHGLTQSPPQTSHQSQATKKSGVQSQALGCCCECSLQGTCGPHLAGKKGPPCREYVPLRGGASASLSLSSATQLPVPASSGQKWQEQCGHLQGSAGTAKTTKPATELLFVGHIVAVRMCHLLLQDCCVLLQAPWLKPTNPPTFFSCLCIGNRCSDRELCCPPTGNHVAATPAHLPISVSFLSFV